MVTGINAYNPYVQQSMLDQTYYNPVGYTNTPVFTSGVSQDVRFNAPPADKKDNTADGKDDGSIGFWGATKNLLKGAWNFVTSPFKNEKGEWSLWSTIKSAAVAALFVAGNVVTGGALTPILLAAGAVAGTVGAVKAGYNIATAETDAEAEAAWQSMGSSAATIAATVVGAKGYAKAQASSAAEAEALAGGATAEEAAQAGAQAAARYNGVAGAKNAVGRTFVDSGKNIRAGYNYTAGKFNSAYQAYKDGTLKTKVSDKYHEVKDNVVNRYNDAKTGIQEMHADWKAMTAEERKEAFAALKQSVIDAAKDKFGSNRAEVLANAKAAATNPENIGIHNWLTTQTVKPNFYDSLSKEEQRYFDSLPKQQQEQLEDYYYSMV